MSLVHKVKNEVTTFGDVAADLHGMVCKEGMHSNRIDVVFDTYQTIYIKKTLKGHKEEKKVCSCAILHLLSWLDLRLFLKQANNKASLIEFLIHEWQNLNIHKNYRTRYSMPQMAKSAGKFTRTCVTKLKN